MAAATRHLVLTLLCLLTVHALAGCIDPSPSLTGSSDLSVVCGNGGVAFSTPACSIWRLCQDRSLRPPMYPNMCITKRIAATLCMDDQGIVSQIPGCSKFVAQKPFMSPDCQSQLGFFSVFSTSMTAQAAGMNCAAMGGAMGMPGCDTCPSADQCMDPMRSLGVGCADMRMMGCNQQLPHNTIVDFCSKDAAGPNGEYGYAASWICMLPGDAVRVPMPPAAPAPTPTPSGGGGSSGGATGSAILQALQGIPNTKTIVALGTATGYFDQLAQAGTPFTIFVPTDKGLASTATKLKFNLSDLSTNTAAATSLLKYHTVPGTAMTTTQFKANAKLTTSLTGKTLVVKISGKGSKKKYNVKGGKSSGVIITANVKAGLGTIQVIDGALLPVGYTSCCV